jgi:NAD(P)-dependent dehydrogenase (short-subunit alcohol dehydrogenase family)
MMKTLGGKNAVVTGASQGIGAAIAIALAEAGANVAINFSGDERSAIVFTIYIACANFSVLDV